MERIVPALIRPYGVNAAGISGTCGERTVAALPVRLPDRMDRRKVKHVKTEVAHVREARDHTVECAMLTCTRRLRAREKLVPGRKRRCLSIDDHGELARVTRDILTKAVLVHESEDARLEKNARGIAARVFGCGDDVVALARRSSHAGLGFADQIEPMLQMEA